jgi:hypothetical protein
MNQMAFRPPAPEPGNAPLRLISLLSLLRNNPLKAWRRAHFEQPFVRGGLPFMPPDVVSDPVQYNTSCSTTLPIIATAICFCASFRPVSETDFSLSRESNGAGSVTPLHPCSRARPFMVSRRDPQTGLALSEEELRPNILTLIAAGHETTAKKPHLVPVPAQPV